MTDLVAGTRITAVVTGTNRGRRFFTRRPFVVSRDQTIERDFIPARDDIPAEDRIFVQRSYGSAPELVVSGSIVLDDDAAELINGEKVGVSVDHYGREI